MPVSRSGSLKALPPGWFRRSTTTTLSPRFCAHCCATVSPKNPEPTMTRSAFTHTPKVWASQSGYPSSFAKPHEACRVRRQVGHVAGCLEQPHRGLVADVDHRKIRLDAGLARARGPGRAVRKGDLGGPEQGAGQGLAASLRRHRDGDL